jgi:hypothetical protein
MSRCDERLEAMLKKKLEFGGVGCGKKELVTLELDGVKYRFFFYIRIFLCPWIERMMTTKRTQYGVQASSSGTRRHPFSGTPSHHTHSA